MESLFNAVKQSIENERKRKEAQKQALRQSLQNEIEAIKEQMRSHQPIAFKMPVLGHSIEEPYMALLGRQEYVERKLERLKDVRLSRWYEPFLYFLLEIFLGVFVIYTLLYRVMGEEYFSEVTMTFGLDIDPLYVSLGFEALVIVMFSVGMKLYVTSRFEEMKKEVVAKIMKYSISLFIGAYMLFVYLSNM